MPEPCVEPIPPLVESRFSVPLEAQEASYFAASARMASRSCSVFFMRVHYMFHIAFSRSRKGKRLCSRSDVSVRLQNVLTAWHDQPDETGSNHAKPQPQRQRHAKHQRAIFEQARRKPEGEGGRDDGDGDTRRRPAYVASDALKPLQLDACRNASLPNPQRQQTDQGGKVRGQAGEIEGQRPAPAENRTRRVAAQHLALHHGRSHGYGVELRIEAAHD